METCIAGHQAIIRHEGRLVMGWVETLGILRYGDTVAEVLSELERAIASGPPPRASVARRRLHMAAT